MKTLFLICVAVCCANPLFAQSSSNCCLPRYEVVETAYYLFSLNGQKYRFEGEDAHIAASNLNYAAERHFLFIDEAAGSKVRVYKLKKKGEYAVVVGTKCFRYCSDCNCTNPASIGSLRVDKELGTDDSEGFVLGKDPQNVNRLLLAIFKK